MSQDFSGSHKIFQILPGSPGFFKDLPEFPNSKILADQGLSLGLKDTPAYIIGNLDNETIQHMGFGAISVSRLKENIYTQLKAQESAP